MDPLQEQPSSHELFQAQSHVYKHIFNFVNSMSLACALELGIPDAIHDPNHPITPQKLASLLKLPTSKTDHLRRLMNLLVHNKLFLTTKFNDHDGEEKEGYIPTLASKLLVQNEVPSLYPYVQAMTHPVFLTPWQFLGKWFQGNESTLPFKIAHGVPIWEFMDRNLEFNRFFNKAMASHDSHTMTSLVTDSKEIFDGVESLVDVGGGTGNFVKIIMEAFPHITCTVFDLPHVVADLPEIANLKFIGGDMFQSIPSADAILFKAVLHDWCDEDCVKILKRCRESMSMKDGNRRKVIIIEMVIDGEKDVNDITEMKLFFDMVMMVNVGGKERNEKEWEKLFLEAGFSHYKITPVLGFKLMSSLVHNKFFSTTKFNDHGEEEEGYVLTPASKLLLKSEVPSVHPFVQAMTNPVLLTPWQFLVKWFPGNESTPFEVAHGIPMWGFMSRNSDFSKLFNEAMASDCQMMAAIINDFREIFDGVETLVDVGGGTGDFVKIILQAFPQMKFTVFDLPHVVADLSESGNLKFVGGDMFQLIPSADAILFKWVLHVWSDEDCVKILKRCREFMPIKDGKRGKVIIIDIVMDDKKDGDEVKETKLIFDILMMVNVGGKERNQKEWEKLFLEAGFSHYKITPVSGFKSLIEVFP